MSDESRSGARTGEHSSIADLNGPTPEPTADPGAAPVVHPSKRVHTPPVLVSVTKEIRNGDLESPMEFPDFMLQLGLHFKLPERPEVNTSVPAAPPVKKTRKWIVGLAVLVIAGAGVVSTPLFTGQPPAEAALPPVVLGEWRPNSSKYAGRKFTLTENRVRIEFGELAAPVEFPVTQVRRSMRADTVVFDVLYEQERGETRFTFKFLDGVLPEVLLSNPANVVWRRDRDILPTVLPDSSPVRGVAPPPSAEGVVPPGAGGE